MIAYTRAVREGLVLALLLGGCAAIGGEPSSDGGAADLTPARDLLPTPDDLAPAPADAACTLGSAEHCGTCTTVCPPGRDDGGTLRSCSLPTAFGVCGITCRGLYYDVNASISDGCELEDTPEQDTIANALAITLPDVVNDPAMLTNPRNVVSQIYSDARMHELAPSSRPTGSDDVYAITAVGVGDNTKSMTACLGITSFPTDNNFEVCVSNKGVTTFAAGGCGTVLGGAASKCVLSAPPSDTGTYYVRVRKLAGSHSPNKYALFLQH